MNHKKQPTQKLKKIYRHLKEKLVHPLTKIFRGSIILTCLKNVKSSLQKLVKTFKKHVFLLSAHLNPATSLKGKAMKNHNRNLKRLATLGAITLLSAFLIACGGGGGGTPAAPSVPPTPPVVVTPTTPVVTPTVPVVTPTVSVTCPNTNPVVVVQGSNANDYINCPAPTATSTWAAAKLANPPVATNTKYRISSSTNGGQVVDCNLASLPCFFPNIGNGVIKIIQTPVKMVGNPDPVEAARDIVFALYREGNSGGNGFCNKMLYADTGLPVFGLSQDSLSSFGCAISVDFAIGTPNGIITHDSRPNVVIENQCTEWYWNQTTLQWTARAVSAATCTTLIALP